MVNDQMVNGFTILFLRDVSYHEPFAVSLGCLVRLVPRLAGSVQQFLYPFDSRLAVVAAVVVAVPATPDPVGPAVAAVAAVAAVVAVVADLGSDPDFVVAVVAAAPGTASL